MTRFNKFNPQNRDELGAVPTSGASLAAARRRAAMRFKMTPKLGEPTIITGWDALCTALGLQENSVKNYFYHGQGVIRRPDVTVEKLERLDPTIPHSKARIGRPPKHDSLHEVQQTEPTTWKQAHSRRKSKG